MKRQEGRQNRVSLGTSMQLSAVGGGEQRRDEQDSYWRPFYCRSLPDGAVRNKRKIGQNGAARNHFIDPPSEP